MPGLVPNHHLEVHSQVPGGPPATWLGCTPYSFDLPAFSPPAPAGFLTPLNFANTSRRCLTWCETQRKPLLPHLGGESALSVLSHWTPVFCLLASFLSMKSFLESPLAGALLLAFTQQFCGPQDIPSPPPHTPMRLHQFLFFQTGASNCHTSPRCSLVGRSRRGQIEAGERGSLSFKETLLKVSQAMSSSWCVNISPSPLLFRRPFPIDISF